MKKIGSSTLLVTLFIIFFLWGTLDHSNAQSVSVTASVNSSSVVEGSDFLFSIEVSGRDLGNIQRPEVPNVDGIQQLSGFPSTSTSFSIVNGVATSTYGYRFTMRAVSPGEHTIPPIRIHVGNDTFTTNPVTITVNPRGQARPEGQQQDEEIFVRVELSNERPFAGQQVSANIVLYFKDDIEIVSYQPSTAWRTEGFWVENVTDTRASPRAEAVILNGIRYRKATIMNYVLIPTRSGSLNLGSFSVRANVRPSFRNTDPFRNFQMGRNQRSVQLQSEPVELSIRNLPGQRPQDYSGAVGRFTVSRSISSNEVTVGEPIEVTTTFDGTGNIALINQPRFNFPETFDMFAPRENQQTDVRNGLIAGTKTFTHVLIPREPGDFEIPAESISWFDDSANRFRSTEFASATIKVNRDPNEVFSATEVARLSFHPITGIVNWQPVNQSRTVPSFVFLVFMIIPLVVVGIAWMRKRHTDKLMSDPAYFRKTYAFENAQKRLDEAQKKATEQQWKEAYLQLYKAFTIYVADRTNLSESGASDDEVMRRMESVYPEFKSKEEIRLFLKRCTTISYAPGEGADSFDNDIAFIKKTLNELNQVK